MGVREVLLAVQALPTSLPGTAQYTYNVTGTNQKMNIRGLIYANRDSADHPVTLHHTTGGAAAANGNIRWPATVVPANTLWEDCFEVGEWVLTAGDAIYIFSDSALVNVYMSGEADE